MMLDGVNLKTVRRVNGTLESGKGLPSAKKAGAKNNFLDEGRRRVSGAGSWPTGFIPLQPDGPARAANPAPIDPADAHQQIVNDLRGGGGGDLWLRAYRLRWTH